MLQTLETFNQQREKHEELRAQIAEAEYQLDWLQKQMGALCDDNITEKDVLIDALDVAGIIDYEIQPWAYGQKAKPYTITRIVKIEGLPVRVELDRATGILLLDGKAQTLTPVLP